MRLRDHLYVLAPLLVVLIIATAAGLWLSTHGHHNPCA